jgi:hypothetical protein
MVSTTLTNDYFFAKYVVEELSTQVRFSGFERVMGCPTLRRVLR